MGKHVAHRLYKSYSSAPGIRYIYRGVLIECTGYFHGEHCVCWEAIDKDGYEVLTHGLNLMTVKKEIDSLIEEYANKKFPGYDDFALKRNGISKEIYLKYKDK